MMINRHSNGILMILDVKLIAALVLHDSLYDWLTNKSTMEVTVSILSRSNVGITDDSKKIFFHSSIRMVS